MDLNEIKMKKELRDKCVKLILGGVNISRCYEELTGNSKEFDLEFDLQNIVETIYKIGYVDGREAEFLEGFPKDEK